MPSKPLLIGTALAAIAHTASADCLVGDIMYQEGQSTGHIGLKCFNSTSYIGSATACGPNGKLEDTEMEFTCPESVPYCMQCGPKGWGAALCLSVPDLGNRVCADADDNNDEADDDDEDFLPVSTPAPATPIMFDACDNPQDMAIWTSNGGEASRPEHSNYCSREYNEGGCFLDSACIESCFQEVYGYSAECSKCFGDMPTCSIASGCMMSCAADSLGTECLECNAPCVEELNECTGLPEVENVPVDPSTSSPTTNPTTPLPTPNPTPMPIIMDTTQTNSSPTSKPSSNPTVQTASGPDSQPVITRSPTNDPSKQPTNSPTIPDPNATPSQSSTGSPTVKPTRPVFPQTTNAPTGSPSVVPTGSPIVIAPVPVKGGGSNGGSASYMAKSMVTLIVSIGMVIVIA